MNEGLSVVVVPVAGGAHTQRCLETLRRESPDELLVVPGAAGSHATPEAELVACDTGFVPMRRLAGARAARCEWVAFVEDTTLVARGWGAAARSMGEEENAGVLSGPVHLDRQLAPRQLALGIVEYARYARPGQPGAGVPGNAFIVRRSLLERPEFRCGIFEDRLPGELKAAALAHLVGDGLSVVWAGGDARNARLGSRAAHGRLFAARRMRQCPPARRWLLRLACPALVAWLPLQGLACTMRSGYWRAWAWVVAMQLYWALGEIGGYWAGAGNAGRVWH